MQGICCICLFGGGEGELFCYYNPPYLWEGGKEGKIGYARNVISYFPLPHDIPCTLPDR